MLYRICARFVNHMRNIRASFCVRIICARGITRSYSTNIKQPSTISSAADKIARMILRTVMVRLSFQVIRGLL